MLKRLFDIVFSILALMLFLPIFILIAILIKLEDKKGSIFFKQKRLGLNGKEFTIYKFRTMYVNSDKILDKFLKENPYAAKEWKIYRKLKSYDPRVTKVGKILRKHGLDELPQFFNILKGDMSIVGPRPYLKSEFEDYEIPEEIRKKILSVKPGITGLWQTNHRNEEPFMTRIEKDIEYIEKKSLFLDILIILKTIRTVLTGKGGA